MSVSSPTRREPLQVCYRFETLTAERSCREKKKNFAQQPRALAHTLARRLTHHPGSIVSGAFCSTQTFVQVLQLRSAAPGDTRRGNILSTRTNRIRGGGIFRQRGPITWCTAHLAVHKALLHPRVRRQLRSPRRSTARAACSDTVSYLKKNIVTIKGLLQHVLQPPNGRLYSVRVEHASGTVADSGRGEQREVRKGKDGAAGGGAGVVLPSEDAQRASTPTTDCESRCTLYIG
eukprot:1397461-Pyramimonas_sp.AAC.3